METQHPEAVEAYKQAAAGRALELVRPGMLVGLGTGSTAGYFIEGLGARVRNGLRISAVATSLASHQAALALGIPVVERTDRVPDLTVDGADEVDPERNCIKGRGGALLREKIVAHASRRFVVIADDRKVVPRLGRGPVPVEVVPFLWEETSRWIERLGGGVALRGDPERPYRTDNGNLILDVSFGPIEDPAELDRRLHAIPGVVEDGLFVGMARAVIVAGPGRIRLLGDLSEG